MCDYSLEYRHSRKAVVGETLVSHRFPTGTTGFRAESDIPGVGIGWRARFKKFFGASDHVPCPVCLPPGAELFVSGIAPEIQSKYGVPYYGEAMMVRLNPKNPYAHHDALQFGGECAPILLHDLPAGVMTAVVLSLSSSRPVEGSLAVDARRPAEDAFVDLEIIGA